MAAFSDNHKRLHQGRSVKRFREMLGVKQEGLAFELGEEWSQKRVSLLEQKEVIDDDTLEKVARVLKVPAEVIRNFDGETAIGILHRSYDQSAAGGGDAIKFPEAFNPVEKWVAALEENEKLYERLLKSEQEKVAILQRLLEWKAEGGKRAGEVPAIP